MLHRYVLHNDEICEASSRLLSPGQVGLLSGWGVFSTLQVASGVPFAFERHWARMLRDAAVFHVPMPADSERVRRRLLDLIAANQAAHATMRLVVVRNGGGLWAAPGLPEFDLLAMTAGARQWGEGVKLTYVKDARFAACPFAGNKVLSWAMNLTWFESAQRQGFDEAILLNERGEVAECTSANIFAARGSEVWTPPLSSGCLPGVTREVVLGETASSGIDVVERPITPEELEASDEIFITSTTRDLLPVLEIDGRKMQRRGAARQALQTAFSAYVRRYIAARGA
ncbi:MAG TPA: aminotransferase class IV [Bryobacteraceae bacterium]|nr:aminotransferase class IV [Bryobacteraceae bacterium]